MNKAKKVLLALIAVGIIAAIVLYLIPWGGAESEVKELEITKESSKVESEAGVEINDVTELNGVYTTFDIDSATSELMFSIDALQGTVGKFKKFEVEYTAGNSLDESKIMVDIDVSSIYTANGMRDDAIRNEGFFEVVKFPSIVFNSTKVEFTDTAYLATGDIGMMGITEELLIPFAYKGKSQNNKGEEVAIFEGNFIFDRTKYGMEHTASVGDEVKVSFTVQLAKQNE